MAVFGSIDEIHSGSATIIVISLLVFLLLLDFFVAYIERMSHKYGFEELTHKLFKEFMIMGKI
jgi:hypothetical protein